jgi:hypothetical protein
MQLQDYATVAVSVMTIIGGLVASVRWLVKHYLAELKPNSGTSMRDAVNINSERLDRVEQRVDQIYLILCESKSK